MRCITCAFLTMFMHFRCVITMLKCSVLVGWDWAEPMIFLLLHVTCSCILHAYVPILFLSHWYLIVWCFFVCVCLSLSFFRLVALWHLNENPLYPGTLFIPGHLFLLPPLILPPPMSGFMMIKPVWTFRRTSHDEAFIWNAKLFYWIFPILTFPLSPIVGVGSHLSLHDHTRVLLQYAQIWLFNTSFCHSRSRYAYCSHFRYCIRGATCS